MEATEWENSVNPDQTAPYPDQTSLIWVHTVCIGLSDEYLG